MTKLLGQLDRIEAKLPGQPLGFAEQTNQRLTKELADAHRTIDRLAQIVAEGQFEDIKGQLWTLSKKDVVGTVRRILETEEA